MFLNNANATRSVPNLLNLTQTEALRQIDDSDFFERGDVTSEYSSTVEEGRVISQNPVASKKAERGTEISLVISKGEEPKETVVVPDLRGKTPPEAQAALAAVGLKGDPGDSVYDADVEAGKVATQEPVAGMTAKEGDTITYQLSKGVENVEIPDVTGYDSYTAAGMLEEKGLVVDYGYESNGNIDEGYVIRQSPTGTATKGSSVTIIVSTGPEVGEIPWVVGSSENVARSLIEDAGYYVNVTHVESYEVESGVVIEQSNSGSAAVGQTVTLTVSSGPGPSAYTTPEETGGAEG
jgi:serine/threonine-protein kinase